jgi:nondiscriminating glutamyl-tRNA synthetase
MAPSPTGSFHIGNLRTALYDFLFARKNNGTFILRIEDTDQNRLVPGAIENIVQTLAEFKLTPDEGFVLKDGQAVEIGNYGPYLQSKRLDIYKKYSDELIAKQAAYHCFCSIERLEELRNSQQAQKVAPKYDKLCLKLSSEEVAAKLKAGESHVIRLNVPGNRTVAFDDLVFGHIEISSNEIDDQVLIKSDGYPTYPMAVVIDDHLMKITHITRSDEFIASTPKHILLYEAFGWEPPKFMHFPPVLSKATKKKMSKREGDVSVQSFLEKGYLPEAMINFMAFLGWNPKTEQEIFSLVELVQEFSVEHLHKSGAVFDLDKLDWFNSMYIRQLKPEALFALVLPYLRQAGIDTEKYPKEFIVKILDLERERLKKLSEIGERVKYFFEEPEYDPQLLIWKKTDKQVILKNLESLEQFLQTLSSEKFKKEVLEAETKKFIETNGMKTGEVLWPLRVALTGLDATPGPYEIIEVFASLKDGKELILKRINRATELLF